MTELQGWIIVIELGLVLMTLASGFSITRKG